MNRSWVPPGLKARLPRPVKAKLAMVPLIGPPVDSITTMSVTGPVGPLSLTVTVLVEALMLAALKWAPAAGVDGSRKKSLVVPKFSAPGERTLPQIATDLQVIGQVPEDLNGLYVRNGPNAFYPPQWRYHAYDGDGMLHAFDASDTNLGGRPILSYIPDPVFANLPNWSSVNGAKVQSFVDGSPFVGDVKVSAIRSTHIPGHASYRVDTPAGSVVIGGDATNDVLTPPRSHS